MPVNPIEASLSLTQEHLYKDENITVYSIPIMPTLSALDDALTMSKRKRDASPSSPVKRARVEEGTPPKSYETLSEALNDPKLCPVRLEGPVAHEYRKLMVKTMFPASQKSTTSSPSQKSGKKKGKATDIAVDTLPEVPSDRANVNDIQYILVSPLVHTCLLGRYIQAAPYTQWFSSAIASIRVRRPGERASYACVHYCWSTYTRQV